MKGIIASLGIFAAGALSQKCPVGGVDTAAVLADASAKPQNVPQGCAAFEILVGSFCGSR